MLSRGDYGFDAPYIPIGLAVAAVVAGGVAVILFASSWPWLAGFSLAIVVVFALSTISFVWTTRRGKFIVWDELLDALALRGDERLLDVGCGRGMVLVLAAKRLPAGRAVGIDLWSTTDQSGNREEATLRIAELEGVRDRIELRTADMRQLPFPDQSFDVVTSSLAIHNIKDAQGRDTPPSHLAARRKIDGRRQYAECRQSSPSRQPSTRAVFRRVPVRDLGHL